jgi:hypothetical protein
MMILWSPLMYILEVRPWRLVALFAGIFLLTAYLPHPKLGAPLPQSINTLIEAWMDVRSES